MAQTKHVGEPIFYETLAAAAKCSPADALEHLDQLESDDGSYIAHPLTDFLTEYAQ